MNWKKLFIATAVVLTTGTAYADPALIGSWQSGDGDRYDILDGFKPNVGAVITYEDLEASGVGSWSINSVSGNLKIGYWNDDPYTISNDGKTLQWGSTVYQKVSELRTDAIVDLKTDPNTFIDELTKFSWSFYSTDKNYAEFTKTFSSTEGVRTRFDNENNLDDISTWGVASGALKIGDTVYLEARITPEYFIAIDDDDDMIVLHRGNERPEALRTELTVAREAFLKALTTGAWQRPSYYGSYIYRFRPLEGDLKGLRFTEEDEKLTSINTWEFSVATGAFKFGYTEYVGGLVVGELLVFVEEDGDQTSYYRDPFVEQKHFTSADTRTIAVSERTTSDLVEAIGRQLALDDTFYLFEFNADKRTGYLHEWTSDPFQITGETLDVESWYEYEKVYLIEDYVAFGDDGRGYKIDTRQSRLRPKTDAEAKSDAEEAEEGLASLQKSSVKLVITRTNGSTETIKLPLESLSELKSMVVIAE